MVVIVVVIVVVNCHVDLSCGRRAYTHYSSTPPRLVKSGCRAYESFLVELVFACFSGFVACLAIVQVLCVLTHHVLELHRLDEIYVPIQVFLSTQFTTLYFLVMSCISTLSLHELVLEIFSTWVSLAVKL